MNLFVLIDGIDPAFRARYGSGLEEIQAKLLKKIQGRGNVFHVRAGDYPDAASFYKTLPALCGGQDILILDAYAGALCTADLDRFLAYQEDRRYEVLFAENLPEGLLPSLISADFIEDLLPFIPEGAPLMSSFKNLVNWEFKGVDVGIWLSPSKIILKRAAFLPEDKGSVQFVNFCAGIPGLSIEALEGLAEEQPAFPRYVAVELADKGGAIDPALFRRMMEQLDAFAPEAILSLGIHGEVFSHPKFSQILGAVHPGRTVLVESPSEIQEEGPVLQALSRPNTEVIFTYTPSLKEFLLKFPENGHLWARLPRKKDTESLIRPFLNEFAFLAERAIIAKADSFGDPSQRSVDLSPITRHACYALGREMLFTPRGELMVCRQAPNALQGSWESPGLERLWALRRAAYQRQKTKPEEAVCPLCPSCDDWWIFNF